MNSIIRRKLAMVSRVRDFCRQHPSDTPGYLKTVAQLEERMARAEALATQQRTGVLHQGGSTSSKAFLREVIREHHLRHLVRIARGAAGERPDLPYRFRLPKKGINGIAFVAAARAMSKEAADYWELFIEDGMPVTFLENLDALLAEYEAALSGQHLGAALHIGAVAELPELTRQLFQLVKRLDGLNHLRFEYDPELRGAWLAARRVAWPGAREEATPPVIALVVEPAESEAKRTAA